ncbi:MAG: hypothetical protein ACRDYA_16570 [Egibacteraceae bacterium]
MHRPLLPITDRPLASVISVGLVAAVLVPVVQNWRSSPRDSFPLSYYPMFTAKRKARMRVTHFVGLDGDGRRVHLPHDVAGSGGLNQLRKQIRRTVERGNAEDLCRAAAERVARRRRYQGVIAVQVVTGTYRPTTYFAGQREPDKEVVHACAPVPRAEH